MKRQYVLNACNLNLSPWHFLELAKTEYSRRFPGQELDARNAFAYCIIYLVINPDKTMRIDFKFPQETPLEMSFVHKRPSGARPGEAINNTDIREFTDITIPPYDGKYYFDFILYVLDITTGNYWVANLWTQKVCPDLRYYLSAERKLQYQTIGASAARSYTQTFVLGHVNIKRGKFRSSAGIRRLTRNGWIPTISLLPQPYGEMVRTIESTNDMNQVDSLAVEAFNANRFLDDIVSRWVEASLVRKRQDILLTAVETYRKRDYHSSVYIMLPQIEGLVTDHIKRTHTQPKDFLKERFRQFGDVIKAESYTTEMTRYLTDVLVFNLTQAFYRTWYPYPKGGKRRNPSKLSPQRNVVLHGEIDPRYFTPSNCLKLISTLDAIILLSLQKSEIAINKKRRK